MLNAVQYLDYRDAPFPPPQQALQEPNGLLAIGGDLSPKRLVRAYRNGIFPWFNDGDPILWWSPDPRAVFYPDQYQVSKSTRRSIRRNGWHFSVNQAFEQVISACAAPRGGEQGTWICAPMRQAYLHLHQLGFAHSIEVWQEQELIGGLYGLGIGAVFCGESMFHRRTDASKAAFFALSSELRRLGVAMIDAQIENDHLRSLGAQVLGRDAFLSQLQRHRDSEVAWAQWRTEQGEWDV
ncbi:leucyl/phenylalanyl-tRNA--protein transferase [Ferrimonas marina]|uniref:Leucyl/phenylalanyl-tRNA--protein transferase n=1 Tax=Ferrimonas marina TaxID=299255 RepID=A0A1M5N3R6_9GAMM|nr:leucyl/phenylalanyl-tRNA--protein transferase [Ferrimonas marina]SHG84085.1 leucyl/phenylalanyl-tRNA--protein transferase [Ferrimonas marina]